MKCYRRRRRYNRLSSLAGSDDEDDQNQKIAMLGGQNQSQVKYYMKNIVLPKLHQKKMTSITLLKRVRDAYVEVMHSLAENVVQLNNGSSYLLLKKPPSATSKVVRSSRK